MSFIVYLLRVITYYYPITCNVMSKYNKLNKSEITLVRTFVYYLLFVNEILFTLRNNVQAIT